ncbi:MAG: hypothetical protein ACT4N2_16515 [Hyphomicrobium sp.]
MKRPAIPGTSRGGVARSIPDVAAYAALGFKNDEIARLISIEQA